MRVRGTVAVVTAAVALLAGGVDRAGAATGNLVKNPGAESGLGAGGTVYPIPQWMKVGEVTALDYGAIPGFPTASSPGPATRGQQYFWGGPTGSIAVRQIGQFVQIAPALGAKFQASAFLGGLGNVTDYGMLVVRFYNAQGSQIGPTSATAPITPADRGNQTAMVKRTLGGTIPSGARSASVQIIFVNADNTGAINGIADNVVFKQVA